MMVARRLRALSTDWSITMSLLATFVVASGIALGSAAAPVQAPVGPEGDPCPGCVAWRCDTRGSVHLPLAVNEPDHKQAVLRAIYEHTRATFGGEVPASVICTTTGG